MWSLTRDEDVCCRCAPPTSCHGLLASILGAALRRRVLFRGAWGFRLHYKGRVDTLFRRSGNRRSVGVATDALDRDRRRLGGHGGALRAARLAARVHDGVGGVDLPAPAARWRADLG